MVLISHDRHLINSICNRVIGLENGAVTRYMGDWEYYIWKKERESADILQQGDPADAGDGKGGAGWGQGREAGGGSAGGESYRVRKEVRSRYRRVEKSILELEEKRDRLDAALADDRRAADHEFCSRPRKREREWEKSSPPCMRNGRVWWRRWRRWGWRASDQPGHDRQSRQRRQQRSPGEGFSHEGTANTGGTVDNE